MKIAVTISVCRQVGMDEWKNYYHTKSFDSTATIDEINSWIKTISDEQNIFDATISNYSE